MTYTEIIESVLNSDQTSYSIAKAISVPVQTIDRYRNGSKIDNMKLYIAEKLVAYYMNKQKNTPTNQVGEVTPKSVVTPKSQTRFYEELPLQGSSLFITDVVYGFAFNLFTQGRDN